MRVSVVDPVGPAIERVKLVLFGPFDFSKWLGLGLCAFLANLGEGGGSGGNFRTMQNNGGGPFGSEIAAWVESHLALVAGVGLLLLCVGLVVGAVLVWLSSRGKFMFLDGVVRNSGAVVDPWKVYRPLGNSLAKVRFVLAVVSMGLTLLIVLTAAVMVWPDLKADAFGDRALAGVIFAAAALLCTGVVFGVIGVLIEDFVVPTMYQFALPFGEASRLVAAEVIGERVGTIVLYFLMKIVLGIATGIVGLLLVLVTCCIAIIPYVGTVVLLPVFVFARCYPLCFLAQLGPDWDFFGEESAVGAPSRETGAYGGPGGGDDPTL